MTTPRTIDNLGPSASQEYALNEKLFGEHKYLIEEAPSIAIQTEIQVTSTFLPVEIRDFFSFQPTQISWFTPPPGFYSQKNRLFTYQLIPSMGEQDKKELQMQKILTKIDMIRKEAETPTLDKRQQYQMARALEFAERAKQVFTGLFEKIEEVDKAIIEVNSKRSQYQKG